MLDKLITRATLEKLAGTTAFRRGEEYLSIGAVDRLRVTGEKIAARVEGTETCRVELRGDGGNLDYDCTCPRAADGYFCKHCVAVGLAWLAEQPSPERSAGKSDRATGKAKRRDPWQDIRAYLRSQPTEALAEMLLDVAQRDDGLYRTLLLGAERAAGGGRIEEAFRRAIDDAVQVPDYIDWREARAYADGVRQVADSLREPLEPESAGMLVGLAEHMIEGIEHALEQVDDSDGYVGEIVQHLGGLHLQACVMARSDPAALAERLFRLETTLPFSLLSFDPATYRRALGRKGLQRYRELAEAEWAKIGPRTGRGGYDRHREAIGRIMERLAETSGDVDELVAIKSRDLSSGYRYLAIARTLAEANRVDEALDWAERGLRAFPERPSEELRDFLVAAYLKRKRNDEALALTWAQFEERPGLDTYRKLHGVAGKLGIWTEQRSRALGLLERAMKNEGKSASPGRRGPSTPDCSLRVSIALWEKDLDAGWTAAQRGICARALLIELAGKLEAGRPDDAVSLYRRVVPALVGETGNSAYQEAIRLVRKVGGLLQAQGRSRDFAQYLAELRAQCKPKRNFIKLLDGVARPAAK